MDAGGIALADGASDEAGIGLAEGVAAMAVHFGSAAGDAAGDDGAVEPDGDWAPTGPTASATRASDARTTAAAVRRARCT
jgi:hypothetical protein